MKIDRVHRNTYAHAAVSSTTSCLSDGSGLARSRSWGGLNQMKHVKLTVLVINRQFLDAGDSCEQSGIQTVYDNSHCQSYTRCRIIYTRNGVHKISTFRRIACSSAHTKFYHGLTSLQLVYGSGRMLRSQRLVSWVLK